MRMRQQASDLLKRLMADRDQVEQRQSETGKRDPMKFVTGRSALDNAIAATRELILRLDALLGEMNGTRPHIEVTARLPGRAAARLRAKAQIQPLVAGVAP